MEGNGIRACVAFAALASVRALKAFSTKPSDQIHAIQDSLTGVFEGALDMERRKHVNETGVTSEDFGHWWPDSRGPRSGADALKPPPADLSQHLAWTWQPPEGTFQAVIAGGPVIDQQKNIYVAAGDGIRKFDPSGKVLWHHKAYGTLTHSPALMGNTVLAIHSDGTVMALNIDTGNTAWSRRYSAESPEGMYPAGYHGKWIYGSQNGADSRRPGGQKVIAAVDAHTGDPSWTLRTLKPVVNFAPTFPGDGTLVAMDMIGTVYRVNASDGTKLWESRPYGNHRTFSEGGAELGPDGVVYACSNPGTSYGLEGERGVVRAYALKDGAMLWDKPLPHPCNSRPTVAKEGQSLVITAGARLQGSNLHGSIMALDAKTGNIQWRYQAPRLGGSEGAVNLHRAQTKYDQICKPSHWSTPRFARDGSVWASRADGKVYNVKGPATTDPALVAVEAGSEMDADFQTTAGVEVQQTTVHGAPSAGSMAFAPGLTVVTTCDTLSVFKH